MGLPSDPDDYKVGEKVLFTGNEIEEYAFVFNISPLQLRLSSGHIEEVDPIEVRSLRA